MKKYANINGLEIAVIGMAGRFPEAKNIEEFWDNLRQGKESISRFTNEELIESGFNKEILDNPKYVKAKGYIKDIEYFDNELFGYSPVESQLMDPQFRLLQECVWEALENAGYANNTYNGNVGIYAGANFNFQWQEMLRSVKTFDFLNTSFYNCREYLTTQLSYKLNLKGPSVPIITACSTSLVAVHIACQGLYIRDCNIALAGGVSISLPKKSGYLYQDGMIYSKDGHCRAFDAEASGTVFGDGAGVVVLKRLKDALKDGDSIYAVIKGSAINNDGNRKMVFSAPSVLGQKKVISDAFAIANINFEDIGYIETHGTGTKIGDPIEIEALTKAFNTPKKNLCKIGSVKTNVGHLGIASGITGFIKTVLTLKNGQIPPSLNYKKSNEAINFKKSPFNVNTTLFHWIDNDNSRKAGVSSFGIGGTNAHVVLEEAPETRKSGSNRRNQLLLFSAKSELSLNKYIDSFIQFAKNNTNLNIADSSYTLSVGRETFEYKKHLVYNENVDFINKLNELKEESIHNQIVKERKQVVFMFPGQGNQYINMAKGLYDNEPIFKAYIDKCNTLLKINTNKDILEIVFAADNNLSINQTNNAQIALFIIEYSLASTLLQLGIQPDAMIGHSIGEYVAACLSGVFTLEDAISLVNIRGEVMLSAPSGSMLSIRISEKKLLEIIPNEIEISVVNTPEDFVVSGTKDEIQKFKEVLDSKKIQNHLLQTSHAFHSKLMDSVLTDFKMKISDIKFNEPRIPFISNITGNWITSNQATDIQYWTEHIRKPVQFSTGCYKIFNIIPDILLEVGPGNSLQYFIGKHPNENNKQIVIPLIRHPKQNTEDDFIFIKIIGALWEQGIDINWENYFATEKRNRIPLPTYEFDKKRFWIDSQNQESLTNTSLSKNKNTDEWFYIPSWKKFKPIINTKASKFSKWLIFNNENDFGNKLTEQLEAQNKQIVNVLIGEQFSKNKDEFEISASNKGDYIKLFNDFKKNGNIPDCIVHLWNLDYSQSEENVNLENQLNKSFYSLLYLAQAILENNIQSKIKIAVISNQLQKVYHSDIVIPEKATLIGALKTIPQEVKNISSCSLDILVPFEFEQELVSRLLIEIEYLNEENYFAAYRGLDRWVQTFEHVSLPPKNNVLNGKLKTDNVYLITGGLGGIGLIISDHLVKTVKAKLIITTNSYFPAKESWEQWISTHDVQDRTTQRIIALRNMEKRGAEVLILKADVSDCVQMNYVITQTIEKYGTINGIIHAAGNPGIGMIQNKTKETIERVLKPKIKGLRTLEAVTDDLDLDFILLFSSTISIIGGFGQIDYCAANAFMDSFAHNSRWDNKILSINWDAWAEVGMATRTYSKPDTFIELKAPKEHNIIHPLVSSIQKTTNEEVVYNLTISPKEQWFLLEHKINDIPILPNTAYIYLAYATLCNYYKAGVLRISELNCVYPLMVGDMHTKNGQIQVTKENNNFNFEIKSIVGTKNNGEPIWQINAVGKAEKLDKKPLKYNVDEICSKYQPVELDFVDNKTGDSDDQNFRTFGQRWNSIKRIYKGEDFVLGLIELCDVNCKDFDNHQVSSVLFDCVLLLSSIFSKEKEVLPIMFYNINIFKKIPASLWGLLKLKTSDIQDDKIIDFELNLIDKEGNCILMVESFILKEINTNMNNEQPNIINNKQKTLLHGQSNDNGISNIEGTEVLDRILEYNMGNQIIVSTRALPNLIEEYNSLDITKLSYSSKELSNTVRLQKRPQLSTQYVPPSQPDELMVFKLWQELLGIEKIGIDDNFFEIGGNSLIATQFILRINEEFNVELPVKSIFEYSTINQLSKYINVINKINPESHLKSNGEEKVYEI